MKLALQKSLCFKKKKTFSSSEESSMNIAMLEEKKKKVLYSSQKLAASRGRTSINPFSPHHGCLVNAFSTKGLHGRE